jgi:hypothetical protein
VTLPPHTASSTPRGQKDRTGKLQWTGGTSLSTVNSQHKHTGRDTQKLWNPAELPSGSDVPTEQLSGLSFLVCNLKTMGQLLSRAPCSSETLSLSELIDGLRRDREGKSWQWNKENFWNRDSHLVSLPEAVTVNGTQASAPAPRPSNPVTQDPDARSLLVLGDNSEQASPLR